MAKIAFIGLGNMGSGMCANLVRGGHDVYAYDLNASAIARLEREGASATMSIAEAAGKAQVVITMLPSGEHVKQAYLDVSGIAAHAAPDTLLIDCSTISVADARDLNEAAQKSGFEMVDAPVSGGVAAAKAGSLTFMVGATAPAFERARPILSDMGKKIVPAGAPGNGQAAKLANNMLLAISMIATSEAFALAKSLGVDAQTFFDISSAASGQNWSMTSYCPAPGPVSSAPSNFDYAPGFATNLMLKDVRLAVAASDKTGVNTPLGRHAAGLFQALAEQGYGDLDFSSIYKGLQEHPDAFE